MVEPTVRAPYTVKLSMLPYTVYSFLLLHLISLPLLAQRSTYHRAFDGHIDKSWTEWTSWSVCSRSCGGGVRTRTRTCRIMFIGHKYSATETCLGDTIEYELCRKQKCPSHAEDFLSYQCGRYKHHAISGRKIDEWIPYMNVKAPCQLQCLSGDRSLSYKFGKVIDGTKCHLDRPETNSNGICVNGRCTNIDCAGQLGSDNRMDRCGVCRGDNSSCIHYRNSYWSRPRPTLRNSIKSEHHYDYNLIVEIPSGATHLFVMENSENNFLAAVEKNGKFLVNNNWKISSPGRFQSDDGFELIYTRNSAGRESLSADGTTSKAIQILVLGKGDLPTVNYEYWISRNESQKSRNIRHSKSLYNLDHTKEDSSRGVAQKYVEYQEDFNPKILGFKSYYDQNQIVTQSHHKSYGTKKYKGFDQQNWNQTSSHNQKKIDKKKPTRSPSNIKYHNSYRKGRYQAEPPQMYEMKSHWRGSSSVLPSRRADDNYKNITLSDEKPKKFEKRKKARRSRKRHADRETSLERNKNIVNNAKLKNKCSPCSRVKNPKKHFCTSDFALRATILESEIHLHETRYEIQVIQSYKNTIPILSKEFIWSPDTCKCPRLRVSNEYILMGHLESLPQSRESKLLVDKTSFVRRYSPKRARTMQKLVRDQIAACKT